MRAVLEWWMGRILEWWIGGQWGGGIVRLWGCVIGGFVFSAWAMALVTISGD